MRPIITILISLFIFCEAQAQNKLYVYYFDEQMNPVSKEQAVIVGKGSRRDSIFLMQFYTLPDNRLFLIEMFKDSTLNVLHGNFLSYYPNRKKAESAVYNNNMLHGISVKWDSLERITDSIMYYEDMPVYVIKYSYNADDTRNTEYEFGNDNPKKYPDENAVVLAINGTKLEYNIWKPLAQSGKYSFRQDKINPKKYLIFRFSDDFFDRMVRKDSKPKESDFFKIGQPFSINETDINGNKLKSKNLKGTILVVNYWFIGCPPCRAEIPELNEIAAAYKDSANVKFIGIALDAKEDLKTFLKKMPFRYQIVADGRSAAEQYGIHLFPTHVIVDGDGKVYFHTVSSPRALSYWIKKSVNELLEKQQQSP